MSLPAGVPPDPWPPQVDQGTPALHDAAASPARIRVVIADADPVARRALRDMLEPGPEFVVPAEACDGVEAVEFARFYRPDVLLADVAMPRLDGIEVARRIAQQAPEVAVIVLASSVDEERALDALRAGASGFLAKDTDLDALLQAAYGVVHGEAAISRSLTMRLVERLRHAPQAGQGIRPVRSPLTTREWEVLDLLSAGAGLRGIARALGLTEDTVHTHIRSLTRKLGVRSAREAVHAANSLLQLGH